MTDSSDADSKLRFRAALEKRDPKLSSSLDRKSVDRVSKLRASTKKTPKMFRRKSGS
jgi:hypothetical protein